MENSQVACENSEIVIYSNSSLSDLKYADDEMPLDEDASKLEVFVGCSNDIIFVFEMCFGSLKCNMVL